MESRSSRDSARVRHSFRERAFSTPGIVDTADTSEDFSKTVAAHGYRGLVSGAGQHSVLPGIAADNAALSASQRSDDQRFMPGSSFSRPFVVRAQTTEDDAFPSQSRAQDSKRPRTRTIGGNTFKTQDSAGGSPTLRALESSSRQGKKAMTGVFGNEAPKGRPSTAPGPAEPASPGRNSRHGMAKVTKRTARSASSSRSRTRATETKPIKTVVPKMNARNIFHQMNSTRGSMNGYLYTRTSSYARWSSTGQCIIEEASGALMREASAQRPVQRLIPSLYRCKVKCSLDHQGQKTLILETSLDGSPFFLHIRPRHTSQYDAWFAALLCWQIVQPGHPITQAIAESPTPLAISLRDNNANRLAKPKEPAIIKVGEMMMVEETEYGDNFTHASPKGRRSLEHGSPTSAQWCKVSCRLQENGMLKIYSQADDSCLAYVNLAQLTRSAVQRLHISVLDADTCLAIYPQYARLPDACSRLRPIYLSPDSQVLYESWFALLRAFTIPEIYGPQRQLPQDVLHALEDLPGLSMENPAPIFRTERSLEVKVCEARFHNGRSTSADGAPKSGRLIDRDKSVPADYYAELALDGQVKCKTSIHYASAEPSWWESFDLLDIPSQASCLSIRVKKLKVQAMISENRLIHTRDYAIPSYREHTTPAELSLPGYGEVAIDLAAIEQSKDIDKRWPMLDQNGDAIGDLLIKLRSDQEVVLMDQEYNDLSELLHRFGNSLTIEIAEYLPNDLNRLSQHLLNIYQVSGKATAWFKALAEEEIDGILKDQTNIPSRFNRRLDSNDSTDSQSGNTRPSDWEAFVRDTGKTATAEANLLFRGNTLLTKALDSHMKRLGLPYLEDTLGDKLREINRLEPDCEVDPTRLTGNSWSDLSKHWRRLLGFTEEVWNLISRSASRCPVELRIIFRHIRACANDRYGDFLRTVSYSSVAAFLFLRFFCAAVLNPRAFGLTREIPKPRAQRTFTLIAKSLQALANMTTSGVREPWMEPMNQFINAKRQYFKAFIDEICRVPTDSPSTSLMSPSYNAPIAMMTRLPSAFKEGFPSLPYLIDPTANFAGLVRLWLSKYRPPADSAADGSTLRGDMLRFHNICTELQRKSAEYFDQADRTERHSSILSQKWVDVAQRIEVMPEEFWQEPDNKIAPPQEEENLTVNSLTDKSGHRSRATSSPIMMAASEDDLSASVSGGDTLSRPISPSQLYPGVLSDHDLELHTMPQGRREKKHSFFGKKKKLAEKQ